MASHGCSAAQEQDGSWFGRWGANYVYGTGAVVAALVAAGLRPTHPAIARAVAWLVSHQNDDGGWGEDLRSYDDPAWPVVGPRPHRRPAGRCRACSPPASGANATDRGVQYPRRHPATDGTLGRALVHGDRFPRRLLHQLPPLPDGVPAVRLSGGTWWTEAGRG